MAESADGQEKTEEPSGKRLSEMESQGQTSRSQEIPMLACIAVGMWALTSFGLEWSRLCGNALRGIFRFHPDNGLSAADAWTSAYAVPMFAALLKFMLIVLAAVVAASLVQTKANIAWKAIEPKFESLNPMAGLKRIFSMQTTVQLIKNSLKVVVIGWIVYAAISADLKTLVGLTAMPIGGALAWVIAIVSRIVLRVTVFLGVLAAADYGYQWYTTHKQAMMTKQEVRDEMKEQDVSPHIKQKVRHIAQERSKRTAQAEVPTADVIVTNPTHYAVAIRYKRGEEPAPRVVAKGQDRIAKLIRELADEHDVPIYEYPELARGLYRSVKEGAFVPMEMYESVARVLAYIYQVRKKSVRGI